MYQISSSRAFETHTARVRAAIALCAVMAGLTGCTPLQSLVNGWLNPSDVGSYGVFGREGTLDIRSSLTLQDAPAGVMGASDPQPEDLIPIVEEYEYGIGDAIAIRIYELLQQGTETGAQVVIDEKGSISLPVVGRIEVVGLTLPEIEAEVVDQIVRRGILVDPEVIVEPAIRRKLSYTIYGAVAQPSLYPLGQYDLHLLDAVNIAGGLVDAVTEIYVVRNQTDVEPVLVSSSTARDRLASRSTNGDVSLSDGYAFSTREGRLAWAASRSEPPEPATATAETALQEVVDLTVGEPATARADSTPTDTAPATSPVPKWEFRDGEWVEVKPEPAAGKRPATTAAPPAVREAREEIIEITVGEPMTSSAPAVAFPAESVPATPSQPRWIYYNGKWIETEAPTTTPAEAAVKEAVAEPDRATQPSIDWAQVAELDQQRVIRISASALREGDPRHNIVIRPGDAIRVVAGEYGEYYLMGHVARPGAYSLTGRIITLKTAIASAGNLGQLAWPTHCTVYRRLGDREQMIQVNLDAIFAGKEQDFFIKKDDLILVGTHPVATFLAVLRNAFRVSYGFGFVYDRNFADIDSYGGQPNPAYQQKQFPNLFQ